MPVPNNITFPASDALGGLYPEVRQRGETQVVEVVVPALTRLIDAQIGDIDGLPEALAHLDDRLTALLAGTPAELDTFLEAFNRFLTDESALATLTTQVAGKQAADPTLTALAAVVTATDRLIYATAPDTFSTTALTAFARSVLAVTNGAEARSTLGVSIGSQVQAWDADLDAIATLATTAFGRALLTLADAAATRQAIGLGNVANLAPADLPVSTAQATADTAARDAAIAASVQRAANGSDFADKAAVRTNLGLGSAALLAAALPGGAATLDASTGKLLAGQIPDAVLGAMRFQTFWNAATNSPALPAPSAANKGFYWIVTTAGATSLAGPNGPITDWQIGDWAVSDGVTYEKIDSSDQVISVAGLQGAITVVALKLALAIAIGDVTGLQGALDSRVRFDGAQALSLDEKSQALGNLDAASAGALATSNIAVNGFHQISARNGDSAVAVAAGAGAIRATDAWLAVISGSAAANVQRVASPFPGYPGISRGLQMQITTAQASVGSADYVRFLTRIEGSRVARLGLGNLNASGFTVIFIARSNVDLTAYLQAANAGSPSRYQAKRFSLVANTDTLTSLYFTPETSGGWPSDATTSLAFRMNFVAGAGLQGASDIWSGTEVAASADITNFAASVGNSVTFSAFVVLPGRTQISGSMLPRLARQLEAELLLCRRYFRRFVQPVLRGVVSAATTASRLGMPIDEMRAPPTLTMNANLLISDGTTTTTIASLGASYATGNANTIEFDATLAASLVVGRPALVVQGGSASLDLSAEL